MIMVRDSDRRSEPITLITFRSEAINFGAC